MKLRVYYDGKGLWAIDFGVGTEPTLISHVIIDKIGITNTNEEADNTTQPRAWLEFIEGRLDVQGTTARIY